MKIIGLTGGIASGKTTIVNFLKKKGFVIHESDQAVKNIYSKSTPNLIKYLKTIKLEKALHGRKINKIVIREEIFNNHKQKKKIRKIYPQRSQKIKRPAF